MIPAFSEISGEWKASSRSRNESPTTPAMNSGMRPFMNSDWSSSAAVTPPIWTSIAVPSNWPGTTSSRICLTRSSVASSCGEVFGITVIRAASPAWLIRGGTTNATSGVLRSVFAKAAIWDFASGVGGIFAAI